MLKATVVVIAILLSSVAWAQQPKGAPTVTLTPEDRPVALEALNKLARFLREPPGTLPPDVNGTTRLRDVEHNVMLLDEIDLRNVPLLGMALSRNSQDPKACALLQRIEPSAVCIK